MLMRSTLSRLIMAITMSELDLKLAVQFAMQQNEACAAVRKIYVHLQLEIDLRKPICVASGKCCHFESYGHRLYITTLELAAFMQDFAPRLLPVIGQGCPLQDRNLCSVHSIRPFGCRIFFCDPSATKWQQDQYEQFHTELKQLHEKFAVPYHYVEWRYALSQMTFES